MALFQNIKAYARKNKRLFFRNLGLSFGFLFIAMAIVGFRVLYPFHFIFSLPFLALSFRYSVVTVLFDARRIAKSRRLQRFKKFAKKYEVYILLTLFLGVCLYILAQVLPSDKHPFEGMTDTEVSAYVEKDLNIAVLHMDRLQIVGDELLLSGLVNCF